MGSTVRLTAAQALALARYRAREGHPEARAARAMG
jgi:hypothetical protein